MYADLALKALTVYRGRLWPRYAHAVSIAADASLATAALR